MTRSLLVKSTCGADAPERANQALTVAATAVAAGAEVSLWLTGEGAWLAVPGRADDLALEHATPARDLLAAVLAGGTVTVCTQCAARRGLTAGRPARRRDRRGIGLLRRGGAAAGGPGARLLTVDRPGDSARASRRVGGSIRAAASAYASGPPPNGSGTSSAGSSAPVPARTAAATAASRAGRRTPSGGDGTDQEPRQRPEHDRGGGGSQLPHPVAVLAGERDDEVVVVDEPGGQAAGGEPARVGAVGHDQLAGRQRHRRALDGAGARAEHLDVRAGGGQPRPQDPLDERRAAGVAAADHQHPPGHRGQPITWLSR